MDTLERFMMAQERAYAGALEELRTGRKEGHWIWYILPQLRGLGTSRQSVLYGIADLDEAGAYLNHPILGPRYEACIEAVHHWVVTQGRSRIDLMGSQIDVLKLASSVDLFLQVAPPASRLHSLLQNLKGSGPDIGPTTNIRA